MTCITALATRLSAPASLHPCRRKQAAAPSQADRRPPRHRYYRRSAGVTDPVARVAGVMADPCKSLDGAIDIRGSAAVECSGRTAVSQAIVGEDLAGANSYQAFLGRCCAMSSATVTACTRISTADLCSRCRSRHCCRNPDATSRRRRAMPSCSRSTAGRCKARVALRHGVSKVHSGPSSTMPSERIAGSTPRRPHLGRLLRKVDQNLRLQAPTRAPE